jgi:uncharacterized protein (DUF4415 family)
MTENTASSQSDWNDDDLPEWTDDQFDRARFSIAGKVIRAGQGTLTRPGRPPSVNPKKQVTLRLDPDVIERFRASGKGWQSRINAELRKALQI